MEHDFFWLFSRFWWLIFPLFWMVTSTMRIRTRHAESLRLMEMIKSYADQGKEPPAALVEMFRAPVGRCGDRYTEPYYTHRLLRRSFLFGFLCLAFLAMSVWRPYLDHDWAQRGWHHGDFGLVIAAVVMGALCLCSVGALLMRPRLPPPDVK